MTLPRDSEAARPLWTCCSLEGLLTSQRVVLVWMGSYFVGWRRKGVDDCWSRFGESTRTSGVVTRDEAVETSRVLAF